MVDPSINQSVCFWQSENNNHALNNIRSNSNGTFDQQPEVAEDEFVMGPSWQSFLSIILGARQLNRCTWNTPKT
jgi:hypothetical protein